MPSNVDRVNPETRKLYKRKINSIQNARIRIDIPELPWSRRKTIVTISEKTWSSRGKNAILSIKRREIVKGLRSSNYRERTSTVVHWQSEFLIISVYFIILSPLNARAMTFVSMGKRNRKRTVIRKAEDGWEERFGGRKKKKSRVDDDIIYIYRRRDISTSMLHLRFIHN